MIRQRLRDLTRRSSGPSTWHSELDARLKIFTSLRIESLDQLSLPRQLDAIGQTRREAQLK